MRFGSRWIVAGLLLIVLALSNKVAAEDLVDAAAAGRVEIQISGLGGSTGDCIGITVRRLVPETLRLTLTAGTVIKSGNQQTQDMVTAKIKGEQIPGDESRYWVTPEIILADDRPRSFIVEAYCLDFHKDNPNRSSIYRLLSVDPRAKQIILAGQERNVSAMVLQAAIWIDRIGVSDAALKHRFPVNDEDIEAARSLLVDINAKKNASGVLSREDEKYSDSLIVVFQDGQTIEVNSWSFDYQYGLDEAPPRPKIPGATYGHFQSSFTASLKTRDLLLSVGTKTERGITFEDNKIVQGGSLSKIAFGYGVTITLVNGDTITVPRLVPSAFLIQEKAKISAEKYVSWSEIHLNGRAKFGGTIGDFSKRLDYQGEDPKPNETISEIHFRKVVSGNPQPQSSSAPEFKREKVDATQASSHPSQQLEVLPWALKRFCDLIKETPSQVDAAKKKLQDDLDGKQVALLFGLKLSSSPNTVELFGPKNLHIPMGEFIILTQKTTFQIQRGDLSNPAEADASTFNTKELLLTGKAIVRLSSKAPIDKTIFYSLVVAQKESDGLATSVVLIDIIDATWQMVQHG